MSAIQVPARSLWRIYALESKYELLKMLRLPMYVIPTVTFPLVFYFLFGVAMKRGSFDAGTYLMATYGAFGVMNAALFGFGVAVAVERGQGWMLFKRATPMPPLAWIFGRLTMCLLFAAILVGLLFTAGAVAAGVRLPPASWLSLAGILVSGVLPFAAFGLAVGFWAGPNSAPAVLNLLSLPLSFASGMWIPIQALPKVVQQLAVYLPPYHYTQLALGRLGMDRGEPVGRSLAVLALFTVVSVVLAWIGWRRDEGNTFG
jgi:ABC-2 type transport system permease protein